MSPRGDQNENVKKMGSPEVAPTGDICSHTCCVHLYSVRAKVDSLRELSSLHSKH